jgi:hypothetical protein
LRPSAVPIWGFDFASAPSKVPLGVDFASTHRSHQKAGKWPFSLLLIMTTLMSLSPSRFRGIRMCRALPSFFLALMQEVPPGSPSSGSIRGNSGRVLNRGSFLRIGRFLESSTWMSSTGSTSTHPRMSSSHPCLLSPHPCLLCSIPA